MPTDYENTDLDSLCDTEAREKGERGDETEQCNSKRKQLARTDIYNTRVVSAHDVQVP